MNKAGGDFLACAPACGESPPTPLGRAHPGSREQKQNAARRGGVLKRENAGLWRGEGTQRLYSAALMTCVSFELPKRPSKRPA